VHKRARTLLALLVPSLASQPDFLTAPLYVGIDAPFGFPSNVQKYGRLPPLNDRPSDAAHEVAQKKLWLWRRIEVILRESGLSDVQSSVSDRLGSQATKAQALVHLLHDAGARVWPFEACENRDVVIAEVYPAATLWATGRIHGGYKDAGRESLRLEIAKSLLCSGDDRFLRSFRRSSKEEPAVFGNASAPRLFVASLDQGGNQLDATVCAMSAAYVAANQCARPSDEDRAYAQEEGWIAVPMTKRWRETVMMDRTRAKQLLHALHDADCFDSEACVAELTRFLVRECFEKGKKNKGGTGGSAVIGGFLKSPRTDNASGPWTILNAFRGKDDDAPLGSIEVIAQVFAAAAAKEVVYRGNEKPSVRLDAVKKLLGLLDPDDANGAEPTRPEATSPGIEERRGSETSEA
jgi:hypothetical protein